MAYTKVFERPYSGGWVDYPSETTQITAAALNEYDTTFQHIEDYLEDNPIADANATITNDYWNAATTYAVGDVVIYLNGLYRCIVANTGQNPTATAYWEATSLSELGKVVFMSKSMTSNNYGYFSNFLDEDGITITRDKYVLFDISSEETGAYYFGMVFDVTGSGIIVKMANQNLQAVTSQKTLTVKYSYIKR